MSKLSDLVSKTIAWVSVMSTLLFIATFVVYFPQEYSLAKEKIDTLRNSFQVEGAYVGTCADLARVSKEGLQDECAKRAAESTAIPVAVALHNTLRKSIGGSMEVFSMMGLSGPSTIPTLITLGSFFLGFVVCAYLLSLIYRSRSEERQAMVITPYHHTDGSGNYYGDTDLGFYRSYGPEMNKSLFDVGDTVLSVHGGGNDNRSLAVSRGRHRRTQVGPPGGHPHYYAVGE